MLGVSPAPRRVFGVHVAGTAAAHHDIWVCRAHPGSEGIRVESIERLADLPGGAADPPGAGRSLVGKIREAPRSAWGFDAAFGAADDARALRRTESERSAPASRTEAREWMRENILQPLAATEQVCALPLDSPPLITAGMPAGMVARAASTYLLEVDGDALARALGAEGVELAHGDDVERKTSLRTLAAHGAVRPMARALRQKLIDTETAAGARAALYCAVAAWRGYRTYDHAALHADADFAREGFIYC